VRRYEQHGLKEVSDRADSFKNARGCANVGVHSELEAGDELEDPAEALARIRHHLARMVTLRASAPLSAADEATYQSLCDAECELLGRAPSA
jgi:hypothetical protein